MCSTNTGTILISKLYFRKHEKIQMKVYCDNSDIMADDRDVIADVEHICVPECNVVQPK